MAKTRFSLHPACKLFPKLGESELRELAVLTARLVDTLSLPVADLLLDGLSNGDTF